MAENANAKETGLEAKQRIEAENLKTYLTEEEVKSDFFMEMAITLQSAEAKRLFRRTFEHIQTQITAATILTRKFGLRELSDENVQKINESLDHLAKEMSRDMAQADHILEEVGIKMSAETEDKVDILVKITCPQGMAFMNLVRQLDTLSTKFKTLWMSGELTLAQSEDRAHAWQIRIFKTADAIRALGQQAYIASDKKKEADQQKAQAKRQAFKGRQQGAAKAAAGAT